MVNKNISFILRITDYEVEETIKHNKYKSVIS